ncbi:TPA: hypothetical protein ACNH39_002171 [Serratia marcescens]
MEFEPTEILRTLNKRVITIQRTTLTLIYIIFFIAVIGIIFGYSNNQKELTKSIGSIFNLNSSRADEKTQDYIDSLDALGDSKHIEKQPKTLIKPESQSSRHLLEPYNDSEENKLNANAKSYLAETARLFAARAAAAAVYTRETSTTPYSYASAIGSLVLKLTLGLFVLYIMRTVFVFIKYYMQLGNDYENQRLAYLLSKGDSKTFRENLETLRGNVIQMERMPKIPQEKLISEIAKVIKKDTSSK